MRQAASLIKIAAKASLRVQVAGAIALSADAAQIFLAPIFAEGFLSPFNDALDVIVAVALCCLIGFHIAFVPTFLVEQLPIADIAPTWTIAYLFVVNRKPKAMVRTVGEKQ